MAFLFSMRSAPLSRVHRRDRSSGTLPTITEDDGFSPVDQGGLAAVKLNYDTSHAIKDYTWSEFDRSPSLRRPTVSSDNKFLGKFRAERGGWKRLAFILSLVLLCIAGLVVGLVLGLRRRGDSR